MTTLAYEFFNTPIYWHFLRDGPILEGVKLTLWLSVLAQAAGITIGIFTALGRLSRFAPFRWMSIAYIWLFRGTPLLVQLAFVYFALPQITNYRFSPDAFTAALIAFSLNEGSYMAEIVRAGISSVDAGQLEAAQSIGMRRSLAMRRIVLPQAIRIIIPPTGNEFISMLKNTSLAATITVYELWYQAQIVYTSGSGLGSGRYFELITVAATWYLVMTTVFSFFQSFIEQHFERGFVRESQGGFMNRFLYDLGGNVMTIGRGWLSDHRRP